MDQQGDPEAEVRSALSNWEIEHEMLDIDPAFADTAQFCERYGFPPERSANTILVASRKGPESYCACVVLASTQLDVNKCVRRLMGVRRASFATADQTMELTGMLIGGVTPFGLPEGIPIYVDESIRTLDYVILGGGSRSTKVKVPGAELAKLPGMQFVQDLSMPPRRG